MRTAHRPVRCHFVTLADFVLDSTVKVGKAERDMAINRLNPSRVCGMPQVGV